MFATYFKRLIIAMALVIATAAGAADSADHSTTTRAALVGAWRLVRIEATGPHGAEADPFYGAGCEGLLIYDATGWFSVQIAGSNRPALGPSSARPAIDDEDHLMLKARALDSYYAYYGTWSFDAATTTVTHRAKGALYPSEHDAIYSQHVEVKGATMTFTRIQGNADLRSVQTKIWERVARP